MSIYTTFGKKQIWSKKNSSKIWWSYKLFKQPEKNMTKWWISPYSYFIESFFLVIWNNLHFWKLIFLPFSSIISHYSELCCFTPGTSYIRQWTLSAFSLNCQCDFILPVTAGTVYLLQQVCNICDIRSAPLLSASEAMWHLTNLFLLTTVFLQEPGL